MYSKMILLCLITTSVVAQQNINENENIPSSNNDATMQAINALTTMLNNLSSRVDALAESMTVLKSRVFGQLNPSSIELTTPIFAISGDTGNSGNDLWKSVEAYDFKTEKWIRMPSIALPSTRFSLGAATLNGKVYAIGGGDYVKSKSRYLHTVDVFDPLTQKWTSAPNMNYQRGEFGVGVLDGKIYVIGGSNDSSLTPESSSYLNSVEMFDGERWTEIGRGMNTKRSEVAIGVLNGNIYAVGGTNKEERYPRALNTVEKMNPATGVWEFVASMNISREHHSVAVLNGKLYAIGGRNGEYLKSVEVYDPDLDRWTFVADLNNPRGYAGAVVYGGQIYVVGGTDRSHKFDTTEVYDPQTGTWTILPAKMSSGRSDHAITLV